MLSFGSFLYTSTHVPALLVILVILVFPRAPLFLVCCLGCIPHVSQTGRVTALVKGGKQAQDPPSLWPCNFTDATAFSSLFFLALHCSFFLYIFYLLCLFYYFIFTKLFFIVIFQGHLSPLSAAFSGCFFGLFCPVLFGGCFLALCRAPVSSDWFFIWDSLKPSSTSFLFIIIVFLFSFILGWVPFSSEHFFFEIVLQSSTLLFY